jgi:hypothetical protein
MPDASVQVIYYEYFNDKIFEINILADFVRGVVAQVV